MGKQVRRRLKCFVVKTAFRTNPNIRVYMRAKSLHVQLFGTPWIPPGSMYIAHQAFLSMGFSRQEYWSGLLYPPPGDLPSPGLELESLTSPALTGGFFTLAPHGTEILK